MRKAALLLCLAAIALTDAAFAAQPVDPVAESEPLAADRDLREDRPTDTARCVAQPKDEHWLDKVQGGVHSSVCHSARWVDGFFGENDGPEYEGAYGFVAASLLYSEHDELEARGRFRAHIPLPNASQTWNAVVGRLAEDEYLTDRADANDPFQSFVRDDAENDWLVGLGYRPPSQGNPWSFSVGVRLSSGLSPYAKANYRYIKPLSDTQLFRWHQTIFWRHKVGFGTTTNLTHETWFSDAFLFRAAGSGTFSEDTQGVDWYTSGTLFHNIGNGNAFSYRAFAEGETKAPVELRDTGFRVTYRRQTFRPWFYVDYIAGLSYIRETPNAKRDLSAVIGIGFELQFGDGTVFGDRQPGI